MLSTMSIGTFALSLSQLPTFDLPSPPDNWSAGFSLRLLTQAKACTPVIQMDA
jgi:hypothetical protein